MKHSGLLLSALLLAAVSSPARAQMGVELSLAQDQFLAGESMPLTVRVVNRSGQTLHLGTDSEWLSFSVESKDGYVVTRQGEVPVDDLEFTLPSAKQAKVPVDLAPYFSFSKPGRYSVTATLFIKEWNQVIPSAPLDFDIIKGSVMWEQEVGLPKDPGSTNAIPEMRRYALHQANYHRDRLMLYVQITDATGKVYKVFPIGPLLSFGRPEPQVDSMSNLHVLYQDGKRSYNYTVVNPHGTVLLRRTYEMAPRPRLKMNSEGRYEVAGGVRRVQATDIPPPTLAEDNAGIAKP